MKKILITSSLFFLFAFTGFGQKGLFGFGWEMNFPNNKSYLTETSYSGGKLEYRYFLKKQFSIGLALNWATYEQYFPQHTYQKADGSSAITGDFVAQVYQLPVTATAHYYFEGGKALKPFAGIALGGNYMQRSLYYNVYVSDNDNWGFVARPEVGVVIQPPEFHEWGFMVTGNYSYATNETEIIDRNNFQNFGLTISVIIHY